MNELFVHILFLHEALGAPVLNTIDGAWVVPLDGSWVIAVNGHDDPRAVELSGGMRVNVPPFHAAVWYNGWLAGLLHPIEGGILAAGTAANETTLTDAIRAAIAQARGEKDEANP